jgi:hypothetical protein
MLTIQRVPNGMGVGVPVCWSRGRKVLASLVRVLRWWVYGEVMYLE